MCPVVGAVGRHFHSSTAPADKRLLNANSGHAVAHDETRVVSRLPGAISKPYALLASNSPPASFHLDVERHMSPRVEIDKSPKLGFSTGIYLELETAKGCHESFDLPVRRGFAGLEIALNA